MYFGMTLLVHTTLFFSWKYFKRRWLLGNWLKTAWWKHWAVPANSRSEDSVLICEQWVKKGSKTFKKQSLFLYCKWWILDKQPSKADLKGLYINGYTVPLVDTFQKLQSLSSLWDSNCTLAEEEKINISYINSQKAGNNEVILMVSHRQWWFMWTIQINLSGEMISLKTGSKVSMPFPKADTMMELYL